MNKGGKKLHAKTKFVRLFMSTRSKLMNHKDAAFKNAGKGVLCREYSNSRSYPKTQALFGPVLEVHFVKILDGNGIEVVFPSVENPMNSSYVVIS